jgi:hypothetical protein
MKRGIKIWEENKILLVLAIILLVCLVVLVGVALKYFYGSSSSVYGNRLDITETVPMTEKTLNNVKSILKEDEKVSNVKASLKGRIVYLSITFVDDTKMDDAKKIAEKALDGFSEEELSVYDIEFVIKSKITKEDDKNKSYTLIGARNANGKGLVWNNYNLTVEEKEK